MQTIDVIPTVSQRQNCVIHIDKGVIGRLSSIYEFEQHSSVFVITDDVVQPLLLNKLKAGISIDVFSIVLPGGEIYKNMESIQKIWTGMEAAGCDRRTLVINLGGGVIGDMGGFAAATYMRGIKFINIPTTLLAQVDASVGGKNGVNFGGIKNLVGTFNQPVCTIIDPEVLTTLPEREFLSGFGEIIKQGLIYDATYFEQVTGKSPLKFNNKELADIIARSCQIKADVVQSDENENGARKILNFGHTIGHAFEALSLDTATPLLHGEAVSIGIMAEADISCRLGLLQATDFHRIEKALLKASLPTTFGILKIDDLLQKMQSDKKNDNGQTNFTLLNDIGSAIYDQKVEQTIVIDALRARLR